MSSKKMLYLATLVVLVLGLSLTGCSKKKPDTSASQVTSTEAAGTAEPLETLETEDSGIMEGRTSGPMVPVYFEFDSSSIAGEQVQLREADLIDQRSRLQALERERLNAQRELTLLRGEATAQTVLDRITPMFQGQLPLSLRVPQMPRAPRAHL